MKIFLKKILFISFAITCINYEILYFAKKDKPQIDGPGALIKLPTNLKPLPPIPKKIKPLPPKKPLPPLPKTPKKKTIPKEEEDEFSWIKRFQRLFAPKEKEIDEIARATAATKTTIDKHIDELKKILPKLKKDDEETIESIKSTISEQLKDEETITKKTIENTKSPTLRRKIIEKSKKFFSDMQKMIRNTVKSIKLKEEPPKIPTKKRTLIYEPTGTRLKQIQKGSTFLNQIAKNPDAIDEILPKKPADIQRILDPKSKISTDELYRIRENPEVKKYFEEYQKVIENISQKLFDHTKKIDPKYTSGTIVIEDKNGAIYKLLKGYVEGIQKVYIDPATDPDKPKIMAKKHETGYARHSSHFKKYHKYGPKGETKKSTQYGIDLKRPILTSTEETKPEDTRPHLLFGQFDPEKKLLFVKFEGHGLGGPKEAALHLKAFFKKTLERKISPKEPKKKEEIREEDEFQLKDRREHMPKEILKEYERLLLKTDKSKKEILGLLEKAKARGVSDILETIKEESEDFTAFATKIRKTYKNNNLDIRIGNEVIIRHDDLSKFEKHKEKEFEKKETLEYEKLIPEKLRQLQPELPEI